MWHALPVHVREGHGLARIPVLVALPEHRPGFTPADEQRLLTELARQLPPALAIQVPQRGHAGVLHALGLAAQAIAAGRAELVLVGGVDSYFTSDTLDWLAANDQLAREGSRSTFFPGEGAGFVAIMSSGMVSASRLPPLAFLRGAGTAPETALIKTDAINQGKAMTSAVQQAAAGLQLPDEEVTDIWADLNGERYRVDEWSYVLLRSRHVFKQEHGRAIAYQATADVWGDVGAASGALLVMMAIHAARRGFADGKHTLVFAGSERGLRSAVTLTHVDTVEKGAFGWLRSR
jgi:3-oxoacyl-[acyl-carrier-protein] synthase-1